MTECLSIFAGGSGILAGDHLKSASDLGVPLVGVGSALSAGIFPPVPHASGLAAGSIRGQRLPQSAVTLVLRQGRQAGNGRGGLAGHPVTRRSGECRSGALPLFLLDTNFARTRRTEDHDITDQLYGGDREMRIRQEIVLGIGGYRALEALGLEPTVYHMNEGHSAFLASSMCGD